MKKEPIVISLGGSIIAPDGVDVVFMKSFIEIIKEYVGKGFNFVIITGGGKVSRDYNNAIRQILTPTNTDLDLIGIASTRLNAEFVRVCFGDLAYDKIILDPENIGEYDKPIILGGGWKPGNSSDLAAIYCARSVGAKNIINLSNIDYVYDKNPREYTDAVPIEKISWADFRNILPKDWDPGANVPFDPIAAREAESLSYEVVIMNGRKIQNLKDYLDGKDFIGTKIF
jgi:uridylate kinase